MVRRWRRRRRRRRARVARVGVAGAAGARAGRGEGRAAQQLGERRADGRAVAVRLGDGGLEPTAVTSKHIRLGQRRSGKRREEDGSRHVTGRRRFVGEAHRARRRVVSRVHARAVRVEDVCEGHRVIMVARELVAVRGPAFGAPLLVAEAAAVRRACAACTRVIGQVRGRLDPGSIRPTRAEPRICCRRRGEAQVRRRGACRAAARPCTPASA